MKLSSYQNLRVPNFSVNAMCEVLKEEGLDWQGALLRAQLDPSAISRLGGTIPGRKELDFQLQFTDLTQDRVDLWLKAAESYTVATFGVRGQAMLTAPTIEDYVALVEGDTDVGPAILEIRSMRTADGAVTGMEITHPEVPSELVPFSVYRDFHYNARILPWIYGGAFPFTKIEFPLSEIATEAEGLVGCAIERDSEALKLWWDPAASTTRLPFGNPFQFETFLKTDTQIIETLKSTGDWRGTVSQAIRLAPPANRKLENVAAHLGVSARTLQRRLALIGADFAEVRDTTLNDLASELLSSTDYSIARISRALGYSDPASFSIAFKRWNGMPPSTFREGDHYAEEFDDE